MADEVSTRMQREVQQHQKDLERIEAKVDEGLTKLRQDMEQMNTNFTHLFEQMMLKMEGRATAKVVVELLEDVDKSKKGSSGSDA